MHTPLSLPGVGAVRRPESEVTHLLPALLSTYTHQPAPSSLLLSHGVATFFLFLLPVVVVRWAQGGSMTGWEQEQMGNGNRVK